MKTIDILRFRRLLVFPTLIYIFSVVFQVLSLMEVGTSHGSQVLSPKYDMDAYMGTLCGGEAWDLC